MGISFWQIAIVVILLVLLFGRGKISDLMTDVAKGITSFKKGLKEEDKTLEAPGQNADTDALMDAEKSTKEKTDA
jgi:sec-independent protein translocase protein TatA